MCQKLIIKKNVLTLSQRLILIMAINPINEINKMICVIFKSKDVLWKLWT